MKRWCGIRVSNLLTGAPFTMMYDYEVSGTIYEIPVDEIYSSHDFNSRDAFTVDDEVRSLAATIETDGGLISAIAVQPMVDVPEGDRVDKPWRIVVGHRRFAACKILNYTTVPCVIREGRSAIEASRDNLVENMHRKDVNILEESIKVHEAFEGLSDKEVAETLSVTIKWVRVRRILYEMPEEIQKAAASGRISQYDVEFIGKAEPQRRLKIFNQIMAKKAGKPVSSPSVKGKKYRKSKRRSLSEIKSMMVHIMELSKVFNYDCSAVTSAFAWVMGNIETREFLENRLPLHYDENIFHE